MRTFAQIIEALDEEQKQLLDDTLFYGSWGETKLYYDIEQAFVKVWGFITDFASKGGHFNRGLGNKLNALFKAIGMKGSSGRKVCQEMTWIREYWVGGKSSLFVRDELALDLFEWVTSRHGIGSPPPEDLVGHPFFMALHRECADTLVGTYDTWFGLVEAAHQFEFDSLKELQYRRIFRPCADADGKRPLGYQFIIL